MEPSNTPVPFSANRILLVAATGLIRGRIDPIDRANELWYCFFSVLVALLVRNEFSLLSCALLLAPVSTRSTEYTGFVKGLPDEIPVLPSTVLPNRAVGTAGSTVVMQRRLPYGIAVHDGRNGKDAVHPQFTGNSPT
jgi:hypothetical protein